MSIGSGIALMVIGAILSFAVDPSVGFGVINVNMIGYLLIGAGALITILGLVFALKKRKTVSVSSTTNNGAEQINRQETHTQ